MKHQFTLTTYQLHRTNETGAAALLAELQEQGWNAWLARGGDWICVSYLYRITDGQLNEQARNQQAAAVLKAAQGVTVFIVDVFK